MSNSRLRVLIVDDNEDLLYISKIYLERTNSFIVDIAPSAPEGYNLLQIQQYDAIISDFDMPDINGIEFLTMIRKNGYTIPFIIFSSKDQDEIKTESINQDSYLYLQKRADPERMYPELIHHISHMIHVYKAKCLKP